MNLDELRLKALQSLKRPFSSSTESPVNETINTDSASSEPVAVTEVVITKRLTKDVEETVTADTPPDKEDGELTDSDSDYKEEEEEEVENDSNSSNEHNKKYNNRFGYSVKPQRNTTWTRNGYRNDNFNYLSDESDPEIIEISDKFDLNSLMNYKMNLLSKIDETQSILAASEEKEQDLMEELQDCRNLQKKCENERFKLERKLGKIEKRIITKERIRIDLEKEVSKNNFKKNFVGKMMKETYMRSFSDRFRNSSLFRMYNESLELDPRSFNRIDPMTPICSVELINGKCPYYLNGTCSMQHIEEIMKNPNTS
jgi:hypothetical protein